MLLPSREDAWVLLNEYTKSESLLKHALAVEHVLRCYGKSINADVDLYGLVGLLHDFDYERFPTADEHPFEGNKILKEHGYPEEVTRAIMVHATYSGVPRDRQAAKALFAFDELTGFIFAVTYVRPSKAVKDVKPKSVKKKLKQRSFAAKVNREDIEQGITELGVDRDQHIQFVIDALTEIDSELGLAGIAS